MEDEVKRHRAGESAYEIRVFDEKTEVWDSRKIESGDSVGIECGAELSERTKYDWSVCVWDKNGEKTEEFLSFETGVSEDEAWKSAEFIRMSAASSAAPIFRREIKLREGVSSARLYITTVGAYEAFVNGEEVYKLENGKKVYHRLNQGYGNSPRSIAYETYDIAPQINRGSIVIVLKGATGWSDENGSGKLGSLTGNPALKAMAVIKYEDGSESIITTNTADWKGTLSGGVTAQGIYYGENYSALRKKSLGNYLGADDAATLMATGTHYEEYKFYFDASTGTITNADPDIPGDLAIPSEIDGVKVISIGKSAFCGCTSLTSIMIPDGVTTIGIFAFLSTDLTSVTILGSVTSIGEEAFYWCTSLADVYYGGTEEQWNKIKISTNGNEYLTNAAIHYSEASAEPEIKTVSVVADVTEITVTAEIENADGAKASAVGFGADGNILRPPK